MAQVNPPPQIKLPKKFLKDPEIRAYFRHLDRFFLQLWTRTGAGTDLIGDDAENVSSVLGLISRLNALTSAAEKKLEDIEQLTVSLNNGFSRVEELNKRFDDLEQSSSNADNLSGKLNSKVSGKDSSTDNSIARFDGKSGNKIQDSKVTIDDISGPNAYNFNATRFRSNATSGAGIHNVTPSATVPGLLVNADDLDSGAGWVSADVWTLIAGTFEAARVTNSGITLKGTVTGPSGVWDIAGFNLAVGDSYRINGISVLNKTTLGVQVVNSSLTSVGTLTSVNTSGAYSVDGTQVVSNRGAAVSDASGGATIDTEARTAINALLSRVRIHGLIS